MRKAFSLAGIASLGLAGLLAACAMEKTTPQPTRLQLAYEQFEKHLEGCSSTHQTDPRTAAAGENELAPREQEWRACAYDGVRTILMPASVDPRMLASLIEEDKAMTEKIAQGQMTRSERKARLDEIRGEIATKERQAARISAEEAEHNAALVRQIRGLP